jgi:mono/diheme cytochrome c family protein
MLKGIFLKLATKNKIHKMIQKAFIFLAIGLLCFTTITRSQNLVNGKKIYETRCLVCHQADGGGVPNMNAPLDGSSNVIGNDIARLVKIIKKGYNERVALDGAYYSNAMTPNPDLTDAAIADVLSYIRNSWSNKASLVTIAQVKKTVVKK